MAKKKALKIDTNLAIGIILILFGILFIASPSRMIELIGVIVGLVMLIFGFAILMPYIEKISKK